MIRIALAALLCTSSAALADTYEVDAAHSQATFSVKHMTVSTVRGTFRVKSGTVSYDDAAPEKATVEVTLDAASVNTDNEKRDGHLKAPDFFDVAKFPTITFKSTSVAKNGDKLAVTGDLTLHGVTKSITLDVDGPTGLVKGPWGNVVRAASASAKLNREDFGLTWNKALEAGGFLVGKDITIDISVELTPPKK